MKKIFTFCAAVLASVSMWAAEPTLAIGTTAQTSSTFLGAYTEQGITLSSSASYSSGAVQLGNTPSAYDAHYFEVLSSSDIIDSISFLISGNGSNKSIQAPVFAWENTATGNTADTYAILDAVTVTANSYDAAKWFTYDLTAVDVKCARIYRTTKGISSINPEYTGSSTALGSGQTIKIYGIKVYTHANCNDPQAHLAFTKSTAYVGEQFSYDFGSKSGGDLNDSYTLNGVPAVKGTDYTFTSGNITVLKAGQFVMHMTVGAVGGYCAADLSDTILINEATPVASVTVDGPTAAYVGKSVTFTATAANASDYAWTVNGVDANTNAAEFTYTPAAAGEYSIVCSARNKFNAANEWIASEPIALNVTKLCGDLITATLNGGSSATMGGVVGGTFDTNLGKGKYKVDKGVYIGVKLASGTFMAGDVVTITMSTAGQNYPCLFGDKDRTNLLYLAEEVSEDTEYQIILPAAATGLTSIYLSRDADDATYQWNPTVSSISVSRSCEASNNAEIAGLTINGEAVEAENGVYSYEVSASENLSQVAVVYSLAHPLASATPASGFTIDVPAAGADANSQVITVTAENGTEATYTVLVAKAAALSDNADLRELTVAGYTLDPEFDAAVLDYTIVKAYAAQMPTLDDVTAFTDHNAAKATIVLNDNVFTITVTAEDNSTKVYTITVNTAAAKKDLLEASFSNGAKGFIQNGNIRVPYLTGEAEPSFVAARFWQADGEPTAQVVEGGLKVVGVDADEVVYPIIYEAVPVADIQLETAITFDSTENYIYSVYGWDASKGWKIAKDVEEAANKRISEGKDRIYMALPAADSLYLTSGSGKDRPVMITVNGVASDVVKLAKQNEEVAIALNASANNFVCIESNGSNGDGGIIAIRLHKNSDVPSALDNTAADAKVAKRVINGQLFIEKAGVLYNAQGAVVK